MDAEQLKQSNRQRVAQISKKTETVLQLADKLERLADQLEGSGLSAIAEKLETFNEKLSGMPEQIAQMQSVSDKKLNAWISQVNQALSSIELNPQFQVDAPNVEVTAPSVDLSPITNLVSGIEKSINSAVGSIKMPEQEDRTDELKEAMEEVRDAINGLIFPVAEHPLPFKDSNGKGVQVQLDGSGNLPISASISGADGAITDGVDTAIKATVKDLTNSNPVTVAITDGNGDQITSFGGGTQYTEGDTDATITGTAMMMEGAANALVAAQGTAADGLLVNLGANNDVTVTGTVTANAGSGTQAVSAASLPLPSGAATSANQTTVIGHLDGVEGLLTTIDADTGNLPTIETNTDFGTVTGGGTETGALRVTVANNSTGVLSVDDNGSTLSVDDGGGSLTVDGTVAVSGTVTVGSHAVTNAGTFAVQVSSALPSGTNAIGKLAANSGVDIGDVDVTSVVPGTGATNLGKAVDAVAGASDTGVVPLAIRDDSLTTLTPADGDYTPLRVNSTGALHVTGGGGGTEYAVDTALGATPTGSVILAKRDDALSALTPIEGDAVELRTDANGALWVSLGTKLDSTNDSVAAVGAIAHDAADSGAPVKVGAKAITALSGATLVASADRTDLYSDLDGAQVVKLNGTNSDYVSGNASNTDGTSTQVIAAGAAGIKHYITDVTITNTSASNIYVELKDGATAKWTFPVPANSGVTHSFSTPLAGTAATAWNFDPSAATTTVYCSASGFKSKV